LVPFIFSLINIVEIDLLCLEVATCLRWSDDQPIGYREVLLEIMSVVGRKAVSLAFINLYREGVIYENDALSHVIAEFCEEFSIPLLNLVPEIEFLKQKGELRSYLRDGIHTTNLGAELYGAAVADFLETCCRHRVKSRFLELPISTKQLMPVSSPKAYGKSELTRFSRSFVNVDYVTIGEDALISFYFPVPLRIHGALFVTGPKAGWIKFAFPDIHYEIRRLAYTETSYYRSISYFMLRQAIMSSQVDVLTESGLPDVVLRKGDPDLGPRETHLAGFLVENAG
jgi:hypothetical protein